MEYLLHIFSENNNGSAVALRQAAGYQVCLLLSRAEHPVSRQITEVITNKALLCLADPSLLIGNTASKIISSLLKSAEVSEFSKLLKDLLNQMESGRSNVCALGAGNCLNVIMENFEDSFVNPSIKTFVSFK